jgi:hypothetical protein
VVHANDATFTDKHFWHLMHGYQNIEDRNNLPLHSLRAPIKVSSNDPSLYSSASILSKMVLVNSCVVALPPISRVRTFLQMVSNGGLSWKEVVAYPSAITS